jgi:hypothetical protein
LALCQKKSGKPDGDFSHQIHFSARCKALTARRLTFAFLDLTFFYSLILTSNLMV